MMKKSVVTGVSIALAGTMSVHFLEDGATLDSPQNPHTESEPVREIYRAPITVTASGGPLRINVADGVNVADAE
jgi:hypothetical protein